MFFDDGLKLERCFMTDLKVGRKSYAEEIRSNRRLRIASNQREILVGAVAHAIGDSDTAPSCDWGNFLDITREVRSVSVNDMSFLFRLSEEGCYPVLRLEKSPAFVKALVAVA